MNVMCILRMKMKEFLKVILEKRAGAENTNEAERIQHKKCNLQLGQQLE
jgi:hypothetical protein